jgi:glycogen debranching enzyme
MEEHLTKAGLGQIAEIFDGNVPHLPRGCFAQAWSVAETLRALCEDVYQLNSGDPAKLQQQSSALSEAHE